MSMQLNIPRNVQADENNTTTAQEVVAEQNAPVAPQEPKTDPKDKKRYEDFRARIDTCKNYRRKLISNWTTSIDYRRGKPFTSQSDDDQVAVNLDWSLTKTKQAALFSQVPQVRLSHHPQSATSGPWLGKFENKLNDTLVIAGVEAAMDECLPDCINASGIGVVMVSFESISEDKEVPAIDLSMLPPQMMAQVQATGMIGGQKVPMQTVPQIVDRRYVVQRISPSDFLWPLGFTGSNFDNAPWIGRSGRITWAEAMPKFKLKEEEKDKYTGDDKTILDKLTHDVEKDKIGVDQMVEFDEIFYKEQQYNPESKSYTAIHHLVFLGGKPEPVIDEPWKGQKLDEKAGILIGSMKAPVRVLTTAYITDEAIPPSDSAIGRPQVNEINKCRGQMIKQRERNIPVRWADINRMDPTIMQALMKGTWQSFIPVQGDGTRVIGEVAKSSHPHEDFKFDEIAKNDLNEEWTIGPNQMGSGAKVETKGESSEIANNFQTRVGRERAKVASFFVGIAEVLGSFLCLYEDPAEFGEGFNPSYSKALTFSILPDSTVLVDANQRLSRLNQFVNTYAKSGFVALEPVLREIAILSGLDPNTVIKAPDPKPPMEPNVSLRMTGAEDMMNPLLLAFMIQSGQAPKPELIEQAKQLIQSAVTMPLPPAPGGPPPPMGPDGQPLPPPPGGAPQAPPTPVGEANPDATILPKITQRSDDPSGEKGGV